MARRILCPKGGEKAASSPFLCVSPFIFAFLRLYSLGLSVCRSLPLTLPLSLSSPPLPLSVSLSLSFSLSQNKRRNADMARRIVRTKGG